MAQGQLLTISNDFFEAVRLVNRASWHRNLVAWVYVPFGIFIILLACFGFNALISSTSVSFPPSVACMILLFVALVLCDFVIGERKTRAVVGVIEVPTGFALRYISLFFTPSFVLLPLSPSIGAIEVSKIIGVFLIGFVVMMAVTAYMTRGLQILLGTSKRAITERAEEMGDENDTIPLTDIADGNQSLQASQITLSGDVVSTELRWTVAPVDRIAVPSATQNPSEIRGTGGPPVDNFALEEMDSRSNVRQTPLPLTRPQRWAAFIQGNLDRITYLNLFLLIGLPIYYSTGYAMPAQLALSIIAYFAALALPGQWRKVLHPVLVSSLMIVLGIWILGLIRGDSLNQSLQAYQTSTRYIQLWDGEKGLAQPGAGDIFGTVLDASIVALALPMFQYRKELRNHFLAIVVPNVAGSLAALFGYPPLCYAIGISPPRSLAFAARSLTLALAKPAAANLGGDINTVAALAIMSGILGALLGPLMLRWLRIPEDDYVTRGVTLGANSSAIATALLLISDPRAAALSSLSMSLFGIITVVLTSVPPVVTAVRSLVGL